MRAKLHGCSPMTKLLSDELFIVCLGTLFCITWIKCHGHRMAVECKPLYAEPNFEDGEPIVKI